ncbi:MAG: hypothetical protein PUB22_09285 [Clostridiales bacterium]|nr:hypothetical protein [Clostridiales bacterium]
MGILNKLWNIFILKRKAVKVPKDLCISGRIYVHGRKGGVMIGEGVTIHSSENVNPTSGVNHTHLRTEGPGKIVIGNHVGISHANITTFDSIIIEDHVLVGSGVKIWDTDFHSIKYEDRMQKPDTHVQSIPVKIKEGAFIGACSIIKVWMLF